MQHRAKRPVADLLTGRMLTRAPRTVLVAAAVLLLGSVAGLSLALYDGASPDRTVVAGDPLTSAPGSQGSEPSLDDRSGDRVSRGASRSPSASSTPETPDGSDTASPSDPASSGSASSSDGSASASGGGSSESSPSGSGSSSGAGSSSSSPTGDSSSGSASPSGGSASASPSDGTPPQTTASTQSLDGDTWTIDVAADEGASYECSLDGSGYTPCGSSVSYDGLDNGRHTFAARATDDAGNTDPSPAQLSETITEPGNGDG